MHGGINVIILFVLEQQILDDSESTESIHRFQLYHGDTKYEYLKKKIAHFPYTCWLGCTLAE
jgi:hypothetical protein